MQRDHDAEDDRRSPEGDEFPNLLETLTSEELRQMLERVNADLAASPDDVDSLCVRGLLHQRLGDDRRAKEDFGRALQSAPGNAEAHRYRAHASAELGEHQTAVGHYDMVIQLEAGDAVTHYSRGSSLAELGDMAGALRDFDRAIELSPDDPDAYYNRGCTYAELGEPDRAVEDLSRAIALSPRLTLAYHHRGLAYRDLGDGAGDQGLRSRHRAGAGQQRLALRPGGVRAAGYAIGRPQWGGGCQLTVRRRRDPGHTGVSERRPDWHLRTARADLGTGPAWHV